MKMNVRKTVTTAALGLGVLAGSAGLASALNSGPTTSTPARAAESDQTQDPMLNGSIQAPDDEGMAEADEAATLADLATISADDASAAAVAANPGSTVSSVELGNENGSVVYEVRLTDASGAALEVKVDAGDGSVLAQESDDENDGNEADEANEADEGSESDDDDGADGEIDDDATETTEVAPAG